MANKKAKTPNLVKVHGVDELRRERSRLESSGYVSAPMPYDGGYSPQQGIIGQSWDDYIHSKLMCSDDKSPKIGFPTLHLSSGGEVIVDKKIGTEGLGYMAWGSRNNNPNVIAMLTEASPYTASAHRFNTDMCEGRGPRAMFRYTQYVGGNITEKSIPHRDAGVLLKGWLRDLRRELTNEPTDDALKKDINEQIAEIEQLYEQWKKDHEALEEFEENNNLHLIFLSLCQDMQMNNLCFPELTLNKQQLDDKGKKVPTKLWTPKITGIRYHSALTCRLERMDPNGRINYVYISNQWYQENSGILKQDDIDIDALPALSPQNPVADLSRIIRKARKDEVSSRNRPTRFILPVCYPSNAHPYYPIPANQSVLSGDIYEYLMTMVSDRNKRRKNSNVIGRILYINQEYMQQLYHQNKADSNEAKTKVFNTLRDQINTFLADRDNMGKPLVAYTFKGADGTIYESWKIVEIEANDKSSVEANQKELAEISSIVFFAYGLDSRLVGNTPGDASSNGGTDQRERFLLKQVQMSPMQQLMLSPLYVVSRFNDWKTIDWEIQREVLTTLDNSKTGVTTQPQE